MHCLPNSQGTPRATLSIWASTTEARSAKGGCRPKKMIYNKDSNQKGKETPQNLGADVFHV